MEVERAEVYSDLLRAGLLEDVVVEVGLDGCVAK